MMNRFLFLSFFFLSSNFLLAQNPNKKTMDHTVYAAWNTLEKAQLSADGNWLSYELTPGKGDATLVVVNTKTKSEQRFKRATGAKFTYDAQHLMYTIRPPFDSIQAMRRRKVKDDDLPNDTLGILNLATQTIERIPDLKSFKVPEKWSGHMAYQLKKSLEEAVDSATVQADTLTKEIDLVWDKKESKENGSRLYIRDLENQKTDTLFYVKDYLFAEEGERLLLHSTGNDTTTQAGIYWYNCENKASKHLFRGKGKYNNLAFDKTGEQASFIVDIDTTDVQNRPWKLYYWKDGRDTAKLVLGPKSSFLPSNWQVNEHYTPRFSKEGKQLFFGINPNLIYQDTSLLPEEIVEVEVWAYTDKRLHTQQKVNLEKDKKKHQLCVYHPQQNRLVPLYDQTTGIAELAQNDESPIGLYTDENPYLETISWEGFPSYKDVYTIQIQTGNRQLVAKKVKGNINISPDGEYLYWYSAPDSIWLTAPTSGGPATPISSSIDQLVCDELNDRPMDAWSYGIAGWTTEDKSILIYDRYDIWQVNPQNPDTPKRLTKGRETKTVYRYIQLDKEAIHLPTNAPILLHTFNEKTCSEGYANLTIENGQIRSLTESGHRYSSRPIKAKNANTLVFTKENFQVFPNLWLTDTQISNPQQISDANPQQTDYSWGTIEHTEWMANDGQMIRGLLVKPENFDPNKQYPLIVNFYERSSDRLHRHRAPFPHRSTINYSFYTNRGYVIFNPDVPYKIGYPGQSAENAVLSGVQHIVAQGFIDKDRIGVQGHSWGGYQIAHLVTKTNIFRCAESGAPVVNMFSAYGGIRWRSGLSRMFQYEHTQSRIGGTIWEKPLRYLENSPIFFADKIETPVLILHNDKDGAVPWYQGIEFFVAMRRLGKPAWLLNYNGEPHWPVKEQNRIDFQTRMAQYFDHYLMDKPQPAWMKRGIPAMEKGF